MTQPINSYNVLIDRFQTFATGHYMINAFTHGILPAIDETKDKQYPWMHVLCTGIVQQAGQAEYSWTVYFFDLPRDKADAHENKREALSDCIRLAQDLIYEIDNGNVLFGDTVDLLPGAQIVPGIDEWTNTLTGVELTFTMAVPDDYDACAIPADFSVGSGTDTSTPGVSSLSFSESLNNTDGVVTLDNDEESPGNTKYYGTNAQGVKGWYTLSATFNCSALENCTVFTDLQTQVQNIEDTYIQSVTGLDTDNTDPQNPVVQIAVDGVTITGSGTSADPLVANGGGGAFIPLAGTSPGSPVTGDIEIDGTQTIDIFQDNGAGNNAQIGFVETGIELRNTDSSGNAVVSANAGGEAIILSTTGSSPAVFKTLINPYSDAATYPSINEINLKRIQFNGQAAPTINDDGTLGYEVDSYWIYNGGLYICTNNATGAAVWNQVGSAGATWGSIAGTLSNQTDLQAALDGKVDENSAITGATKTKITYDAKGLVTAGADAGIADITGLQTALDAKDVLPVVVSSNQTAANDGRYINTASATYTDPTPAEGKGFVVFVRNGTATVGGTAYAIAGTVIHRVYHSGAWANYPFYSGIKQDSSILSNTAGATTVAAGATEFAALFGGPTSDSTTEANVASIITEPGVISNFYVRTLTAQPGTGSYVLTVRVNGVDTGIVITIAAGAAAGIFSDTANTAMVAAGDLVSIKLVNNASGSSAQRTSASATFTRM